MPKRILVVALLMAGAAPLSGQQADRPPQVDVLESAVDAISRMHMDPFTDSLLWSAAIEGVSAGLRARALARTAEGDSTATDRDEPNELDETTAALLAEYADRLAAANPSGWNDVLADAVEAFAASGVGPLPDSLLWEAAIDGMIMALDDPYAELFTPQESEQWEEDTTGNYSGIGLQITLLNEEITVTAVFRGFPASEQGISVGDVIVGVNEHDASDWGTGMAADSIRGPVGTDVEVKIKRTGYSEPIAYNITRAEVHVPAVNWGVLESGIGYVAMDRVARNAAREMSEALAELESRKGLIIDLRQNPGGFLDESLMLADLFLERGSTLASVVQRVPSEPTETEEETQTFTDRWPQMAGNLPLVILVDQYTASGAEILAGALQDYDRAIVLGERSFGKGVVQTVMNLPHRRRLRFTTGTWMTPLGRSLQRNRDSRGFPIEEDLSTLPRVMTDGGRMLLDGGGIFPDIGLEADTLRLEEQALLREANEAQFPLGLRLAEFGLATATARREAGEPPGVTAPEFEGFLAALVEEGLARETVDDPVVRDYLFWRSKMAVAQRMDDIGVEADFRTERDPILTEAIRLLMTTTSQKELLQAASSSGNN